MHQLASVARRLAIAVPTIAGIFVISFVLTRLLPGDPAVYFAGPAATPAAIADLRHTLKLDQPIVVQLGLFLHQVLRGDLGTSLVTGRPVLADLIERFPATLELTLCALLLAVLVALPLGIAAGIRRGSWIDQLSRIVSTLAVSTPAFLAGLLLLFVFYFALKLAPPPLGRLGVLTPPPLERTGFLIIDTVLAGDWSGLRDALAHLALPAIALSLSAVGSLTRITRGAMLTVLSSEYMRAARSYGLKPWTLIVTYALRNALLPILTALGMIFSFLISSNVVIEKVFAWPGIGSYALDALVSSDYAAVQGFVLTTAVLYVLLNILIDLLGALVDVRVRIP